MGDFYKYPMIRGYYLYTGNYYGYRYNGNSQNQPTKVQTPQDQPTKVQTQPVIHVGASPPESKPEETEDIPEVSSSGINRKWIIIAGVVTIVLLGAAAGIAAGVILSNKGITPPSNAPTTSTTSIVTLLTLKGLQFQSSYNDLQNDDAKTLAKKICDTYVTVLANITSGKLTGCTTNSFSNGSVVSRNQLTFAATNLSSLATDVDTTIRNDITNHDGAFSARFNSSGFEFEILPAEKTEVFYTTAIPDTNCSASQIRCLNGSCIEYTKWCDGKVDCPGGYDEIAGCKNFCPTEAVNYCNATQSCIFPIQRCDKYQDCPDDSDESNCPCDPTFQYGCTNGRCIYKEWLCDGVKDCPKGDDESSCNVCDVTAYFTCKRGKACIPASSVCDGVSDCIDSSDEAHCFSGSDNSTSGRISKMIYKGTPGNYICADNWNSTWSDLLCQRIGYAFASENSMFPVNASRNFVSIDRWDSNSSLTFHFTKSENCSGNAKNVTCSPYECGRRTVPSDSVGPYIINGQRAAYGAWPWQAEISFGGAECGGILLNPNWVLTAGHCSLVKDKNGSEVRPTNVKITLGSLHRSIADIPNSVQVTVSNAYSYPNYVISIKNDIALYKLSSPVTYSDNIRPICLPDANVDLNQFKVCVSTGWGGTSRNRGSNDLLQTKMNILTEAACKAAYPSVNQTTTICVGSVPSHGQNNLCSGDSGGPFVCQDQNDRWTVIGVHSYVLPANAHTTENIDTCAASFVVRVTAYLEWITQTMILNNVN